MKNKTVRFIAEVGIFSGLGLALDYIASLYSAPIWEKGGSISLAMVVIFLMAFRWGIKGGLITGLIVGSIQVLWGYAIGFGQVCLDYIFPYTILGLVGIFSSYVRNYQGLKQVLAVSLPILVVCIIRTFLHVLSGIIYFETPFIPSLVYNGPFMLISTPLCIIVTYILINRLPIFINNNDN